jgi:hypothetical protein
VEKDETKKWISHRGAINYQFFPMKEVSREQLLKLEHKKFK